VSTYSERLKDPRWQRRRLEILQRADFSCEKCEAKDKTLHVHHKLYRKGAMPWEYADHELISLCEDCHESWHELRSRLDAAIALLDSTEIEQLIGYASTIAVVTWGGSIKCLSYYDAAGASDAMSMRRAEDVVEILGPGGQLDLEAMRSVMNARLK
jgi:broad specificity phosphatase PhoE